MNWKECIDEGTVRMGRPDVQRSRSLFSMAENRMGIVKEIKMDDNSASVIFTMMYDSMLEMSHAIAALKGYKILNHICTTAFIENLGMHDVAVKFDGYRKIRNSVNYYGKRLKKDFVSASLEEMGRVMVKLRKEYERLSNEIR